MSERGFDTIFVMGHPTKEQRRAHQQFHQHAALRYLVERCTTLEGYDVAVDSLEAQYGMAIPDELRQQSRQRIAQRLAPHTTGEQHDE